MYEKEKRKFITFCTTGDHDAARLLWENIAPNKQKFILMGFMTARYASFGQACQNGHLAIAKWLWEIASPPIQQQMLKAQDYYAFRNAFNNHYDAIINWLLSVDVGMFDHAIKRYKYTERIKSVINHKLLDLRERQRTLSSNNPTALLDDVIWSNSTGHFV